jgi:hypothetical protein
VTDESHNLRNRDGHRYRAIARDANKSKPESKRFHEAVFDDLNRSSI